ncbi:hypothetical protein GGTG_06131 [Gaeumannomyces tritici R3-111a-1]|uniref:Cytochrome P450 n=1 Tax=Gaeumannomyces tritici (strain R3-111a-1) TaxID=644352 RepID=J3NXX6_GAET3|nr:hypothetical protein GGTG_06131 [Gaeumannomyces tritici R3-111a-1]EJT76209.1 hypothetical protein GGTG_06131 [Gaeumannomyces tritici R3-111a-1]
MAILMLAVVGLVSYWVVTLIAGLVANIAKAKKTKLPYLVVFCCPDGNVWYEVQKLVLPIMKALMPASWWDNWLFITEKDWAYHSGQRPWDMLGECFFAVSPGTIVMYTRNPDIIQRVMSQREAFTKPTYLYEVIARYGENVVTTEGAVWRMHRRATSVIFTERLVTRAFAEAVRQTQAMVRHWGRSNGDDSNDAVAATVQDPAKDTMTLALNIVGSIGFGMRFPWPGEPPAKDADPKMLQYTTVVPGSKHAMTFPMSLEAVLEHILALVIVPTWLLRRLPFTWARTASAADAAYKHHMQELLRQRKQELLESAESQSRGDAEKQGDIIQSLLKSSSSSGDEKGGAGLPLTDTDIIGNAFILILAGHETSGDVLHFALLFLALHPSAQLALQADLDRIAGVGAATAGDGKPRPRPSWDQVVAMLSGMPGAVVNETMRMMPPVAQIPKHASGDQPLIVWAGDVRAPVQCLVPDGTIVQVVAVSAHRHPRYWPPAPGKSGSDGCDTDEWVPERWFRPSIAPTAATPTPATATTDGDQPGDDDDDNDNEDESDDYMGAIAFRPARGAFIPFSDGARSCLGRRMAQVEMVAALATLIGSHTVELAVDELAAGGDDEVNGMDPGQRRELYGRASERARRIISEAYSVISLKLQDGARVPIRVVPRGKERFVGVV